jgi:hypothetical protein
MTAENIIATVRNELIRSIAALDEWFDSEESLMEFQPSTGRCVRELLRHLMFTNKFLLSLIDEECRTLKGAAADLVEATLAGYCLEILSLNEFNPGGSQTGWSIDFQAPREDRPLDEVRKEIREQLNQSLIYLEILDEGEGTLYKISLPINGMGNLDVYQSLYFLALYTREHVAQFNGILEEYNREFNAVG